MAAAGLPGAPARAEPVTDADLAGLPAAAVRHLTTMGVVGRPRPWSLRARFTGRLRRRPDQPWMAVDACLAVQLRARGGAAVPHAAHGRPGAAAVWHLPDGDFRYAELTPADLALEVAPGR
ncbi:hypothetical protein GCM10023403_57250 [Pseudonocardia benzenivorans]